MNEKRYPNSTAFKPTLDLLSQAIELQTWLVAAAPEGVNWQEYGKYVRRMIEDAKAELNALVIEIGLLTDELPF